MPGGSASPLFAGGSQRKSGNARFFYSKSEIILSLLPQSPTGSGKRVHPADPEGLAGLAEVSKTPVSVA